MKQSILNQKDFFRSYLDGLFAINPYDLSDEERLDYHHLRHEISINWERLNLEQVFVKSMKDAELSEEGLINAPMGEQWYLYFLKKWLSVEMSAEELMAFGLLEIEEVQMEIQRIQSELGYAQDSIGFYNMLNSKKFFVKDQADILRTFQLKKELVDSNYQKIFYDYKTPNLAIELTPSDGMGDVPGYYSPTDQTFYFNIFEGKYNTRKYDWLFIHEGVPGHHFQINFEATKENKSDF